MKHFLIALTCLATLSGGYLAYGSQNGKDALSRSATGTACRGEVVDGVRGGKITGTPRPHSRFRNLRLGMSRYVVHRQIGDPDDISHRPTGKGFNPFYYGTDRYRSTEYYGGSGVLIFSGYRGDTLIEIHHDAGESGDRTLR
jgi:hypothetical protein